MLIKDLKGKVVSNNSKFINRDNREKWIDNGIKFNGGQVINSNLSGVTNWNTATPFSYNIIFKPTRVGMYEQIINNWNSAQEGQNCFTLDLRLNGTFWVSLQLSGLASDTITIPYTVNETIVVTMTYDGITLKAYKNGALFNSVLSSRIIGDSNIVNIGSVGDRNAYSSTVLVYDVKMFKKTLTETEVFKLFNTRGKVIPNTAINDTLLNIAFEERAGTIAYDKSGNSYNGTLVGFSSTSLGDNNCHVDYTGQPINN